MIPFRLCLHLKLEGFPQTVTNGSWFYIDHDKSPVCLTDVHFLDRQTKSREDPFMQRVQKYEQFTFLIPPDFEASAVSDEEIPLSIQTMQQVSFKRLKAIDSCKMPTFTELFAELPMTLHEHWTKQMYSYEGPFHLRVEWQDDHDRFWAGYARWMGITAGVERTIEVGKNGKTPEEALANLWMYVKSEHPTWITKPASHQAAHA